MIESSQERQQRLAREKALEEGHRKDREAAGLPVEPPVEEVDDPTVDSPIPSEMTEPVSDDGSELDSDELRDDSLDEEDEDGQDS